MKNLKIKLPGLSSVNLLNVLIPKFLRLSLPCLSAEKFGLAGIPLTALPCVQTVHPLLIVQEKEQMAKQRGGGQLSAGGEVGGPLGAPEGSLSPTPTKRTPDSSGAKKCESGLKADLGGNFTTKLKIEPGDSPHGDLGASGNGMTEAELTARRLASLSDNSDHLSPRKEPGGMVMTHYGDKYGLIGKEECGLGVAAHPGHPGHPGMAMSLEPNLHHLTDPSVSCNNFSVDSIMTTVSRDGSPDRLDMAGYRGGPWAPGPVTRPHTPRVSTRAPEARPA